jgi:hypothetical protein
VARCVGQQPDGATVDQVEDDGIERVRSQGTKVSEPGRYHREGLMSASTRPLQQTLGTRQIGVALVAVALAIVLAAAVAFSQLAATKPQTAPAAGAAPVFMDHGSRSEIGTPGAAQAPVFLDRGSRDEIGTGGAGSSRSMGTPVRAQ